MKLANANVVFIDDFTLGQAYKDMVAREELRLAKHAMYWKNMAMTPYQTLAKMKEEFTPHTALAGILERVVFDVYARGLK